MNPAVFVDRDNTLIHNDGDLGDPDQVRLIQGAASAIASLCGLGYRVVVVTNQGGVARGKYREADVEAVHQRIRDLITQAANGAHIERFYFCPFHPEGTVAKYAQEHPNRKPAPGMLQQAARDLDLDLSQSWMIGDQMRDIHAGIAAGTRTILVRPDADSLTLRDFREPHMAGGEDEGPQPEMTPGFLARNMVEAVRIIAQQRKPDSNEDARRSANKRWDAAAVARVQRQTPAEAKPPVPKNAEKIDPDRTKADRPPTHPTTPTAPTTSSSTAAQPVSPASPSGKETGRGSGPKRVGDAKPAARPARPFRPVGAPDPAASEGAPRQTSTSKEPKQGQTKPQGPAPPKIAPVVETSPQASKAPALSPPAEADERTLKLILQELRQQRGQQGDFSHLKIVAILPQLLAIVCLLGGLWMGAHDLGLFIRWLGAALIAQLVTIAILLFGRG